MGLIGYRTSNQYRSSDYEFSDQWSMGHSINGPSEANGLPSVLLDIRVE